MLNLDLIHVLNEGNAVAFVGSGISAEAGLPSWEGLLDAATQVIQARGINVSRAQSIVQAGDILGAFEILRRAVDDLDVIVADLLNGQASEFHQLTAEWPFRLYVTTNFDVLLERELQRHDGWVSVGKSPNQIRRLAGGAGGLVWHPHGSIERVGELGEGLVLSRTDYDSTYPHSRTSTALKALAQGHRLVFIGFGFRDPDLIGLFDSVVTYCDPGRPAFAFIGERENSRLSHEERAAYRTKYNVEVIRYKIDGDDHQALGRLLRAYSPFILTRSASLGRRVVGAPEYDPATTSLLVHNRLSPDDAVVGSREVQMALGRAHILSLLQVSGPKTISETDRPDPLSHLNISIADILANLEQSGLISRSGDQVSLSERGTAIAESARSSRDLRHDQCAASLLSRAQKFCEASGASGPELVTRVAMDFFEMSCRERGLGIAQNLAGTDSGQSRYRATALMQELPKAFESLESKEEVFALIDLVADVLRNPPPAARTYFGLLTQAYFGQQLLFSSSQLRSLDSEHLKRSVFIADSNIVLAVLARGCDSHEFALLLMSLLQEHGSRVVVTQRLLDEVADHARWSSKFVRRYGDDSPELVDASRGMRGYRSNLFLQGFLASPGGATFSEYLRSIFPRAGTELRIDRSQVRDIVEGLKLEVRDLGDWVGFSPDMHAQVEELSKAIAERRERAGTLRSEHQTMTEAEAALMVSRLRDGSLAGPDAVSDAYFLSHTRVIEGLPGLHARIVMHPSGLAEWVLATKPLSDERAAALFDDLLGELSEGGIEFVPDELVLRKFSGVVDAARSDLRQLLSDHRELVAAKCGPDPDRAFHDTAPLDLPFLTRAIASEIVADIRKREEAAVARAARAEETARKSEEELSTLKRFKQKREEKRAKAKKNQRAAASRPGRKRKKKGK